MVEGTQTVPIAKEQDQSTLWRDKSKKETSKLTLVASRKSWMPANLLEAESIGIEIAKRDKAAKQAIEQNGALEKGQKFLWVQSLQTSCLFEEKDSEAWEAA